MADRNVEAEVEASTTQQYCLRWNNHRTNLLAMFGELLTKEELIDVTLAVECGAPIKCHKVVLAACSSYFQTLFTDLECKHPIIVLKDVKYSEMKAILDYMYQGEVNIAQNQLGGLLKVAEALKVKGLMGETPRPPETETAPIPSPSPSPSPPPAISTSTPSSIEPTHEYVSPVHSSGIMYNSHQNHGHARPHNNGIVPRMLSPPSAWASRSSPNYHPLPYTYPSSLYNPNDDVIPLPLKYKKSSILLDRDTPILRTVLGQGHVDSSQPIALLHTDNHDQLRSTSNGSANGENDRRNSANVMHPEIDGCSSTDVSMAEEEPKIPSDVRSGLVHYVPPQKPEWKRYKQYTRNDINNAIEAVRSGMSALQAARRYGVPSRTLYDKVKKMGITTSRPFKRGVNNGSACFPHRIGENHKDNVYGGAICKTENESTSAIENLETQETVKQEVNSAMQDDDEDQVEDLSMTRKLNDCLLLKTTIKKEDDASSGGCSQI